MLQGASGRYIGVVLPNEADRNGEKEIMMAAGRPV
jgi:hypothetical protein